MASNTASRARDIQTRDKAADEVVPDDPTVPQAADPKPVRQTVDIPHGRHQALAGWRLDAATSLGLRRVTNQQVLSALVAELLADETTARKVRRRIEHGDY